MSLLDDVSIVVTPNGYKAGELYAVIPVPTEGAEEVTCGDFSCAVPLDYWIEGTGWNISGGVANYSDGAKFSQLKQTLTNNNTSYYKLTFDTVINNGQFRVKFGSNNYDIITTTGTYIIYGIFSASNTNIAFEDYDNISSDFTIDNVSVKEYTSADMDVTRATDATRVDENGLIEDVLSNVPRIDYTGGGCPHILAEPQSTNFVVTSASGTYGSSPASEILAIAPDGENTAIRPVPSSGSNRYQETIAGGTYSSGDEVTYSWYRKRISTPVVTSYIGDLRVNSLVNCTQVGVTTEIASSINGYDRFSATLSITDGSLSSILRFYFGAIIGDGNSSVAYWGHQLEEGSYATSYIPTSGSTVTRNQDQFTRDGIGSLINSTEGVLFLEMAALADDSTRRAITLSDGSTSNRVILRYQNSSNAIQCFINVAGALFSNLNDNSYTITDFLKIAFKWKAGDFALWINGTEVAVSADATSFGVGVLTELQFNEGDGAGSEYFGKVKQLQVYDTALTDTQLAALTS